MRTAVDGVRYATDRDVERIVALAQQEHQRSQWSGAVAFCSQHCERVVAGFIGEPGRVALVCDGGYLLGLTQHLGFSPQLAALEYAWYAADGRGLALLQAFDRWARGMGAEVIVVHDYAGGEQAGRMAGVLARRYGFSMLGVAMHRAPGITSNGSKES